MLTEFKIEKTFYKTRVSLWVDIKTRRADALVTYDGRIIGDQPLPFYEVMSPEKANAYLFRQVSEYGSWIEHLDASLRIRQAA